MKTVMLYSLDADGQPVPETDAVQWAEKFEKQNRTLKTDVRKEGPDEIITVSTRFLGVDHNYTFGGPPLLWETRIFGGKNHSYAQRYSSRLDALAGHEDVVKVVERKVS